MEHKGTLHELFTFNDWARDNLMAVAADLTDDQLDEKFEMGWGSVRATLNHLWNAERVWLDRWKGITPPSFRLDAAGVTMPRLWEEFRETAAERNEYLRNLTDANLQHPLTYVNLSGQSFTLPLGGTILHVANHGSHHRAQAANMLRRVGRPLPPRGADYIFMKLDAPDATPCELEVDALRTYFDYGDWANARVLAQAANLNDEQLNRPFEMGLGTLRKTMVHIHDAERWWLDHWTHGSSRLFPVADETLSIHQLNEHFQETSDQRNQFITGCTDADLKQRIQVTALPNTQRTFPLGVTMLQTGHHGTHHRAQALNMLRHLGAEVPAMDLALWLRERSTTPSTSQDSNRR